MSLTAIERALWVTILCLANNTEDGVIKYVSEQKIMLLTGMDFTDDEWDKNVNFLNKFQDLNMITHDNGMITVTNFLKRQSSVSSSYERVKRWRSKHKKQSISTIKTDDNVKRYTCNVDKSREDKRRIDKENYVKESFSTEDGGGIEKLRKTIKTLKGLHA